MREKKNSTCSFDLPDHNGSSYVVMIPLSPVCAGNALNMKITPFFGAKGQGAKGQGANGQQVNFRRTCQTPKFLTGSALKFCLSELYIRIQSEEFPLDTTKGIEGGVSIRELKSNEKREEILFSPCGVD